MPTPIVISILANASQANATFNQTLTTTQKVGAGFKKMALPAVAAIATITAAAKRSIDAASDQAEAVSKNGEVFGAFAGDIEKFAARAGKSLGQSKTAALDAASTFGIIGEKAGLSGKDTAAFSKQFVTLASDMASFNNTSPEEAVTAIGAAMRGESEPIRKYGVLLDDATLRNRALKLGLIDNIKTALTPQQKALAASKEILAQTTKAQGDFARTSDGAANKSRILAAQQENLQAKIGKGLLPVYVQLQTILASVLNFLSKHQKETKIVVGVVAALAVGVLAVNAAMAVATAVTATYTAVMAVGRAALIVYRNAQLAVNLAMMANPIGLVILAIVALVAAFVLAYKNSETFRAIIQKVFAAVKIAAAALWSKIKSVFNGIVAAIRIAGSVIKSVGSGIGSAFNAVISAAKRVLSGIKNAFGSAVSYVRGIPGRIRSALGNVGSMLFGAGRSIIQGLINGIKNMAGNVKNAVSGVLKAARNLLPFSPAKEGPFSGKGWTLYAGRSIMQGLIDGVKDKETPLVRAVRDVTTAASKAMVLDGSVSMGLKTSKQDMIGTNAFGAPIGGDTYNLTVVAPIGSSSEDIGRTLTKHIDAYARAGGRKRA